MSDTTTFLFIGDSITDAGRDESGELTPWDTSTGLGHGYVNLLQAMLCVRAPEKPLRMINRGISGNTVLDLEARWQEDVLDLEPDWLSVMIGINDVWRQFDTPLRVECQVQPQQYRDTLRALLDLTRPRLAGLVLMTPYMIEANREDPMRKRMDEYGAIVKELATEFDAILVDTQAAMDRILLHRHPMEIAWDRIHPGTTGHMTIAQAFLAEVEDAGVLR